MLEEAAHNDREAVETRSMLEEAVRNDREAVETRSILDRLIVVGVRQNAPERRGWSAHPRRGVRTESGEVDGRLPD